MSGFDNEVLYAIGERLEPSTTQAIGLMQKTSTDVSRINHTGDPEGVVSANPSSLPHDPVSGLVYAKNTGTGNTGWQQLAFKPNTTAFQAFVYNSIPNVTGDNTAYDLVFNAVTQTPDNSFDGTTGIFTAPRNDYYIFTSTVWLYGIIPSQHFNYFAQMRFNSGAVYAFQAGDLNLAAVGDTGGGALFNYSAIIPLTAGETVNMQIAVIGQTKIVGIQGGVNAGPTQFGTTFMGAGLNIL